MIPKTLVVKVGTSTLTGPDGGIDAGYIGELAGELAALVHSGQRVVLVSSGAVRAGCERLGWANRPRTVPMKQAAAAVGQGRLMEIYASAFGQHRLAVGQLLLTRHDASDRTRYVNARNTLSTLLRHTVVPIINENDTVAVEEIRFGDNDTLAAQVAAMAHADLLILLTDVEGLLDRDGNLIPKVTEVDHTVRALCAGAGATGTGGMTTKLAAAEIASAAGIRTCIARGRPASITRRIAGGEALGTQFLPTTRRLAGRKHWIAYGSSPQGSLSVHPLAEAALVERQKSLLPAGVLGVVGDFRRGETVTLTDASGSQFARGIVSCDAEEIRAVMGLHTSEARNRIGRSDFQEIIHRDNLVLLPRAVPNDGHLRSLEDFGETLRRRYRDQELRERLAALAVLREYFVDYAAISAVERLTAADLTDFALSWLLKSEEANAESAKTVLATATGWLAAIPYLPQPAAREIAALAARLERDVPRTLLALQDLREALAGESLPGSVEVEDEGGGVLEGSLTAGLDRVVRPGEVDDEAVDHDEFIVQAIDGDQLTLRRAVSMPGFPDELSSVRAPATPFRDTRLRGGAPTEGGLPARRGAGYLREAEVPVGQLRPGDILNLELARGAGGSGRSWNVLMVVPGGYAEGG